LELMAFKAKNNDVDLLCPMIDARRMEVFTALYDRNLNEVEKPHALILDENSFEQYLSVKKILFFGNGSEKFKSITKFENAFFNNIKFEAFDMVTLVIQHFKNAKFADLAYAEPAYIKDFFTSSSTYTTKTRPM
jgi:tRNA threonylcarbamoyladenosine biosynthesis protein TsaB